MLLAILLPPVAVLLRGKPIEAVLCLILTVCFWIPGMIYAMWIVNNDEAEKRNKALINEMRKQRDS